MSLTLEQKDFIVNKYNSVDMSDFGFEERVEIIVDYLLDYDIVDLSDDEDGDEHQELYNSVWEYLESHLEKS